VNFLFNDWILIPSFGAAIFIISYAWSDRVLKFLYDRSLGHREYVIQKLDLMFVEVEPKKITISLLLLSFGMGTLAFIAVWPNIIAGMIIGSIFVVAGWTVPKYIVESMYTRRCTRFVDQMVDGLTIMGNGIRSGLSAPQSMERVVENMGNPISQEFNLVLSQMRLGLSFEEALNGLAARIPNPDVQMFVLAINILKETGGNLAETFSTIVETLRDRQKVEKKIEALTAQGIMQGIIISLVPFFLLVVYWFVDPNYVKPLFTTTLGLIALVIMLGLQILGGLMIRSIVKIKV
jgi:tight adherence protein B